MLEFQDLSKEEKEKIYSQAAYILRKLHEVGVWEAGTMTKEDFVLAAEAADILEDIGKYLLNVIAECDRLLGEN